jgi:cephalosporin-C deacetylase-like acetyl esterase
MIHPSPTSASAACDAVRLARNTVMKPNIAGLCILLVSPLYVLAQSLPNTAPLTAATGDERSKTMVAGIDRFAMQLIETTARERHARWKQNLSAAAKHDTFLKDMRQKLRTSIGMVDETSPDPALQRISANPQNTPLAETPEWAAWYVRWPVFDGVEGTGVLIQPKGKIQACIVCLPDADETPQSALFDKHVVAEAAHHGMELAALGCQVVVPLLTNRDCSASASAAFQVKTNVPHREWIYRQAFGLGRNITGYEVASIGALMEALDGANEGAHPPIGITGHGEGGLLALYAAALFDHIKSTWVSRCFTARERLWEEPLDRNAFNFTTHFGSAELAAMIMPRGLSVSINEDPREFVWSNKAEAGQRAVAAPFKLGPFLKKDVASELARLKNLQPSAKVGTGMEDFLAALGIESRKGKTSVPEGKGQTALPLIIADDWQSDHMRQLGDFTHRLINKCEDERNENFWKPLGVPTVLSALPAYEKHIATKRAHFWNDVIGKLPDPSMPMNPRTRLITENDAFTTYEIMLDVWPEVTAWGYLCVPKNIKPGEKRPVVVCQHGLEGLPEDVVTEDEKEKAFNYYKGFGAKLARQGFITFSPHNFYRGKDEFRVIQRKLNPVGKTLFSVIIGQHQRILEWLKTQPNVDGKRIAFYGLSYGGKSAMRIPAVLTDYCLSICSGDFNEWVRKCVSTDMRMSYVFTGEYEIWEPNLGPTFNYAEMAALIAPRPFMVERGHNDGVGIDEWVSYEYAKVRRLYTKLGLTDRTEIEYFDGPHTINGKGTFEFLRKHLNWTP